jgi:putative DNA primase/helicase
MEKFKSRVRNTLTVPSKVSRHGHMNGEVFGLVQLSELPQTSIRWRWPQRIPTGMVTVVAGYQKTGKSLVACDIAATITRGDSFPAGEGTAKRGHVIIVNNEDDPRQILGPRLAAAGADLDRIHIPNSRWILNRANLIEKMESEIKKIQHLGALILDPITSVLSISRNNADDVELVFALNFVRSRSAQ